MTDHDRDTRDLAWLELSEAGNSAGKIASQYGASPESARQPDLLIPETRPQPVQETLI